MQHYNEIKGISICEFLPPHLAIYVDLPAEEVQKKLKQSGTVMRRTHTPEANNTVVSVGYCNPVQTFYSLINSVFNQGSDMMVLNEMGCF